MNSPRLNLVVLRCSDLERAAAFYECLGLSFVKHQHGSGPEHLSCELGQTVFELYPAASDGTTSSNARVGFEVDAVAAAIQLAEANHPNCIVSPAKPSPWGLRAVLSDPDGHRVELVQANH